MRLAISILMGYALGVCNLYLAAKVGFSVGVAFLTAFAWGLLDTAIHRVYHKWQRGTGADHACYLSLTSAMSYGSVTVIATALAAQLLQGETPALWAMTLWVTAICMIGTCLAVPLRDYMLRRYPFPSGRAAAELVVNLEQKGQRFTFFVPMFLTWAWVCVREVFHWVPARLSSYKTFLALELSPMLFGLGAILGPSLTLSMFLGALLFYGWIPFIAPLWVDEVLWFAIGVIVSATLVSLLDMGTQVSGLKERSINRPDKNTLLVLVFSLFLLSVAYGFGWGAHSLWGLLLLPFIFYFAYISGSVTGQTDVVPTGALGKLSLLGLSLIPTIKGGAMLHTGTLTGSAAATSDFLTDLRTGDTLKCSPQRQFRYQLLGALVGPCLFVPTFIWLTDGRLGEQDFPVPAAQIWLGVASLGDALTVHLKAIALGSTCGIAMQIAKQSGYLGKWAPDPLPLAMAALLDMGTCTTLALGGIIGGLSRSRVSLTIWSGIICAEALLSVVLYLR